MLSNGFTVLNTLPQEGETNTHITVQHIRPNTPSTQHTTKTYFKLIQAIHHKQIIEHALNTQTFPAGMMKQVTKLTDFIKPSSPNIETKQKVADNTKNWMSANMHILHEHYQAILNTLSPTGFPFNNSAFQTAVRWAQHRYKHKLRDSTVPIVQSLLEDPPSTSASEPVTRVHSLSPITTPETENNPVLVQARRSTPASASRPTARAKTSLPTLGSSPHVLAKTLPSTLASRLTQSPLVRVQRPAPRLGAIKAPTLSPRSVSNKPISSPGLVLPSRGTVSIPVASTLIKAPDNIPPIPSPTPNRVTLAYPQFTSPPPDLDEFIVDFELREEEFPTLQSIMVQTKHTIAQTKTITVQAQVIHRPCSQLDSWSAPTLTRAMETAQPPQTPIISNVAIQSDLNISDLSGSETNISTLAPTEAQPNIHPNPAEAVIMERGVKVEKVVMMGENKGKINPNSFLSEPSPILTSPHTRYLLPTPLSLSPKNRVLSEPTVRLSPLPSPRHSTPTSPATPPFLYQPTRHDMTNRKIYDWKIKSLKPIAIIGDSNLKRIPYHPYKHIQIDSYPGAQFHHITGVLAKSTPNPNTKVVVLSLGLNNKDQTQKQTPIGQLQSLHSKATVMYPNATIYFPIINYSPHLSEKQQTMLKYINSHIATHYNPLLEIHHLDFHTEKDNIHWTPDTGAKILQHWMEQLK